MFFDLAIIGGGPAGIAAGIYAARKKIKTIFLTDVFGGQAVASADIQNFVGLQSIAGFRLAKNLKEHLMVYQKEIKIIEGDLATKIEANKTGLTIFSQQKKKFQSQRLLIVSGGRPKKLDIPGEKQYEGRGVFYCATCDAPLMKNKIVAVIGGGNYGLETARELLPYAQKIYLLEYTEKLRADLIIQEKIGKSSKIKIITMAAVQKIFGDEFVHSLQYENRRSGQIKKIDLEGVFVAIGYQPNSEIFRKLVKTNSVGEIIVNPKTQETSCKGIWAAGDVTDGLYHQINIAVGDAVKAVLNINDFLR